MKKLLIILLVLFSCQSEPGIHNQPTILGEKETAAHEEKVASEPVSLNNGKRWIANEATTAGIQKMTSLANNMQGNATLPDYYLLRAKLESEFNNILQKCTMTGEAHNQLHNYLLPLKEMIEGLNSTQEETCLASLNRIKHYLGQYGEYFE